MSRGAPWIGGCAALWLLGSTAGAQVSGTLDFSASTIRYDLFRSSTALALSPTLAYDRGWTSVAARGTLLRYASGHRDLHGSLVGTTFTPAFGPFRLELGADLGLSRYLDFATFSHAFGAADLHFLRPQFGAWVGGTEGTTSFGGAGRGAGSAGLGLWASRSWATLTLTVSHATIGDTSYTDLEGTSHVRHGRLDFDGRLGDRVGSTGGGHGVYGDASLSYALTQVLRLAIGAGRYPTDPTRGTIAGRYVTIALRLGAPTSRPADPYREVLDRYLPQPSSDGTVSASLEVGPAWEGGRVLRVHAEGAGRVDVMGDFTDWAPVALTPADGGRWEAVVPISPGPHRVVVRVDGGPWVVPVGATAVQDEFGGEVGLIVVP